MSESQPVVLRSLANPTVKHLVRMRNNRARRRAGRVLVDGWRETRLAIEGGLRLIGLYRPETYRPAGKSSPEDGLPKQNSSETELGHLSPTDRDWITQQTTWVSQAVLEKISYGDSARGVVAEFERPSMSIEAFALSGNPIVMVLDQIEKPGNVGAIFRSVDAAGLAGVLVCRSGDPLHPNAIRSSCGAVFHVPWADADETAIEEFLAAGQFRTLASRVEGATSCWEMDYQGPVAIIVGNEALGLQDRWCNIAGQKVQSVHIPMAGRVDSLNVSVSAALLAFCAVNNRRATNDAGS